MTEGTSAQEAAVAHSQHLMRIEKFVGNMDQLLQRMTERVEIMEADNIKNTMRYNSFREDYKRLIEEQVDMRTGRLKEEFISLDEIRPMKITIKEIEVRLRSKVDQDSYADECQKRDKDRHESQLKLKRQMERLHTEIDSKYQELKNMQQINHQWALQSSKQLSEYAKLSELKLKEKFEEVGGTLKTLDEGLAQAVSRSTDLSALIGSNKQHFEQQLKSKKLEEHKRFLQFEKRINQAARRRSEQYEGKLSRFDSSIAEMSTVLTTSLQRLGRDVAAVVLKTAMAEEAVRRESERHDQHFELVESGMDSLREKSLTEHSEISTELKSVRQQMAKLIANIEEEKQQRQAQQARFLRELQESKLSMSHNDADLEQHASVQSPSSPQRMHPRARSKISNFGTRDFMLQPDQSPSVDGLRSYETTFAKHEQSLAELRAKLSEVDRTLSIIKEMVESRVTFSEIIKLEETKASRYALKDLVHKLELMKSVIERNVPSCDGLKDIVFDEAGITYATLSRISLARSRSKAQSRERQVPSRSSREAQHQRVSSSKLTPTASRLRKRYQTFFEGSEPTTTIFQESRPVYF